MALGTLTLLVRHLKNRLTPEQREFFKCDYSELKEIPKDIRNLIIDVGLKEKSPTKLMYIECGITNIDDMIDNIVRCLYLEVNYSKEEKSNFLI